MQQLKQNLETAEQQIETFESNLQIGIQNATQAAFNRYMEQQKSVFESIELQYGGDQAENLKKDQYQ